MQLEKILKPGTTTARKAFWDSVAQFVLSSQKKEGKNVSVNVHNGYGSVINVNPQRGGQGGVCPDVDTVTATISGITLNCGCIDILDGETLLAQWLWSDASEMNGAHTLTRDGSDPTHWFLDVAGQVHIKTWTASEPNCPTDPPFTSTDVTFHIHAYCVGGEWSVFVTFGASPTSLFLYGTGATGATLSNAVPHCGFPDFVLDMGAFPETFIGANTDGTVVISV